MGKESVFQFVAHPEQFKDAEIVAHVKAAASKKELFVLLAKGLGLPSHFGHNWDAFEECLREFSWAREARSIAIVHEQLPALPDEELETYLDILADSIAAEARAKDHPPKLDAIFPSGAKKKVAGLIGK
jgi:Barstar (barnase inhibitor)